MPLPQRLIRDVSRVSSTMVILIGMTAGCSVSLFTFLIRSFGIAPFNIEILFGSFFTGQITAQIYQQTWWIGFFAWILIAGLSAYAYSFIFWSAHRSGAGVGINLSLIHWILSSLLAGLLPAFHPLLISGLIEGPGFFMIKSGIPTSLTFFLSHILYGAIVGQLFDWAAMRNEYPQSLSQRRDPVYPL
jgi:hypothetical protein